MMKSLTKTTKHKSIGLVVLLWINRAQVMCAVVLALLVCGHAAAQSRFNLATNKSFAHAPAIKENFITVDGLSVRYIESGSGPTVVLIHGNAGSAEDFEFGTANILSSSYHVIAVDRPGHGRSDRPKRKAASVDYQARLLNDVLTSLGVTRPVLVGHSWGAALALSYALQYPREISGLVLLAPAAYPDPGESSLLHALTKPPLLGDIALIAGKSVLGKHVLRATLERAFYPQPVPRGYLDLVAASWLGRRQLKAYLDDESSLNASLKKLSKSYSEIDVPVVIVTGDLDQIVSARDNAYRLKAAITNARLITLKDTGHEIPQTHPESIYEALSLITSPTKLSDVSGGQVKNSVRQVSSSTCSLMPLMSWASRYARSNGIDSDQFINNQLKLQKEQLENE